MAVVGDHQNKSQNFTKIRKVGSVGVDNSLQQREFDLQMDKNFLTINAFENSNADRSGHSLHFVKQSEHGSRASLFRGQGNM